MLAYIFCSDFTCFIDVCFKNNKNKDMKMDFKLRWVQLIALFCLIGMYSGSLDDECKNRKEKINLYIGFETVDLS